MRSKIRIGVNPILVKELRSRMRGGRAFITLTAILLLLGGVSYGLYRMVLATSTYSSMPVSPMVGQTLFGGLAFLLLVMVCGVAPAVTANALSGEHEKLTYEMLLATPLRPSSILWGKLVSALSYVFLLIFAAIPMASLVFIFGGVSPRDMVKALIVLVSVAVMVGVIGLFNSALFRRSGRATVVSYIIVVALLIGPLVAAVAVAIMRNTEPPRWLLVPSPINALASAIGASSSSSGVPGLFWILGGGMWGMLGGAQVSQTAIPRPLYHYSLPLYGLITLVLYLVSVRLVQPTRRWRLRWRDAGIGAGLVLGFVALVAAAFWLSSDRYENYSIFDSPTPFPQAVQAVPAREVVVVERAVEAVPEETPTPTPTPLPSPTPTSPAASDPEANAPGLDPEANASGAPVLPSGNEELPLEEQGMIYGQVIHRVYRQDHTFGSDPEFQTLYLVATTDDGVGDPDVPRLESRVLPVELRAEIERHLEFLHAVESSNAAQPEIHWVETEADVPRQDETGRLHDGSAMIKLGNIQLEESDRALVSASIYVAPLVAGGRTYVLDYMSGAWHLGGTTGVEWMS